MRHCKYCGKPTKRGCFYCNDVCKNAYYWRRDNPNQDGGNTTYRLISGCGVRYYEENGRRVRDDLADLIGSEFNYLEVCRAENVSLWLAPGAVFERGGVRYVLSNDYKMKREI